MTNTKSPNECEYERECERVSRAYENLSPVTRKIFKTYLNMMVSMLDVILALNKEKS